MSKERKGFKQLQGIRGQRSGTYNNIRIDNNGRIYIVTEKMKKANKHK
jgi:hypothetical protein